MLSWPHLNCTLTSQQQVGEGDNVHQGVHVLAQVGIQDGAYGKERRGDVQCL